MHIVHPRKLSPLAGLTLAGLGACSAEHALPEPERLPPRAVQTLVVSAEPFRSSEAVAGTVRARTSATLAAKIPGRITALPVEIGDRVERGQVLARLEAEQIEARLRQARAVLRRAEAELARYTALYEKEAATRQELEKVKTEHAVARAAVEEAASLQREAVVRAPFDGVITQEMADVGDLATPGRPLLVLEAPGRLRFEVAVSETLRGFLERGTEVSVEVADLPPVQGVVGEVGPSADVNSRTYLVKIDLPDTEGLRPGQFGRARLPTRRSSILRVPADTVSRRGQLEYVYVVEEGKAWLRLVETGKSFPSGQVEIAAGLEDGETVVVDGASALVDGQPVTEAEAGERTEEEG